MRIRIPGLLLTAFFLAAGSATHAGDSQLLDFELEDQFGNVHRRSDVQGTVVLLNGSDKGGVQFNGVWGKAIQETLGDHHAYDQISLLAYANLRGVPFFLKKLIRGKFPQEPERWTLMDWKGVIASAYEFAPKSTNLLLFAPDGSLVLHASGRELDEEALEEVVTSLRSLLDEIQQSEP
jgi:hypothetical protein